MATQMQNTLGYSDNVLTYPAKRSAHTKRPERKSLKLLELTSQLHATLDLTDLLEMFAQQIGRVMEYDGITYQNEIHEVDIALGKKARNGCNYQLSSNDEQLGQLTFLRRKAFSEEELTTLENLLCALIFPLRNALLYHSAMRSALIDPLTGVQNRTGMDNAIRREMGLARRHNTPLSVLLLDIDHFKSINDRFGHACGDFVIQSVAECICESVRDSDMVFRFGGEEFLVLLNSTDREGAQLLAERIRKNIEELVFTKQKDLEVTASIGITRLLADDSPESLFKRADAALYRAKKSGRNQVITN